MVVPIERKKVSEQILEQLKKMIKDEVFPPNSKLPSENELAKMFGVSRAPIREALSVLAASGIIESRQGGGSWVKEIRLVDMLESITLDMVPVEHVFDLLEMRSIIESEAAALAASRHLQEDIDRIEGALKYFKETMEIGNKIGHEADFQFHLEIVKASKNHFLLQSVESLSELYEKSLVFSLKKNLGFQRKREQIYQEHCNIVQAIKNREPEEAAKHMKIHLTNVRLKIGDPRV
jgi:GntR family transcriptional regulator, transcriptional repressor for pyruvate dehydrogenase complex